MRIPCHCVCIFQYEPIDLKSWGCFLLSKHVEYDAWPRILRIGPATTSRGWTQLPRDKRCLARGPQLKCHTHSRVLCDGCLRVIYGLTLFSSNLPIRSLGLQARTLTIHFMDSFSFPEIGGFGFVLFMCSGSVPSHKNQGFKSIRTNPPAG